MTETAEPITVTRESAPPSSDPAAQAREDAAAASLFDEVAGPAITEEKAEKAKPQAREEKKPEPKEEKKSEFPDELMGVPKKKEEPAVPTEEDILTAQPKGPVKHEHFAKVQTTAQERVAAAQKERDTFKAQVAEMEKGRGQLPEEHAKAFESLKAELETTKEKLARVAFEQTPEFAERFTNKEAKLLTLANKTAEAYGVDPKVIQRALKSEGRERFSILEEADISGSALSYVSNLLAQHDQLQEEKSEVLAGSKERMAQWATESQAKRQAAEQQRKASEDAAFTEASREIEGEFEPFMRVEGNDDWNKFVESNRAEAKAFFNDGNLSEKELAKVAHYAIGAKVLHKMFNTLKGKYEAQSERLASMTAASPSLNGGGQHRSLGDTTGLSEEQRAARSWAEATGE